ncbi:hypothetical protein [Nocardia farcinica]|uniref:hypothetical protein n=1 Tax=Nocardia farcinica TaxID=37329 RepID=UPI002453FB0A|nr:hypothetical protein [Nocardia farcinica]
MRDDIDECGRSIQLADGTWGVVDEDGWIEIESHHASLPDRFQERLRRRLRAVDDPHERR